MTKERALLLLAFLGVIGTKMAAMEHGWQDAMTPQWWGATLIEVAVVLRLMVTQGKWNGEDRRG